MNNDKRRGFSIRSIVVRPSVVRASMAILVCTSLLGQSDQRLAKSMFHIEGTITSPWDSLLDGVLIPISQISYRGVQELRPIVVDNRVSYAYAPRTEVVFRHGTTIRTVVADAKGFYQAELPIGVYEMTAQGPTVGSQVLTRYIRLFRVTSSTKIVVNGSLYITRDNCDVAVIGDAPERQIEERKNACGGEDLFSIGPNDDKRLQLYFRYSERERADHGYIYSSTVFPDTEGPVFVAYNLFSLEAKKVIYDEKARTIEATGHVVVSDASGDSRHMDAAKFKIENGEAVSLP